MGPGTTPQGIRDLPRGRRKCIHIPHCVQADWGREISTPSMQGQWGQVSCKVSGVGSCKVSRVRGRARSLRSGCARSPRSGVAVLFSIAHWCIFAKKTLFNVLSLFISVLPSSACRLFGVERIPSCTQMLM